MINICEPQCKNISHETFNSGFLYGFRVAYPEEPIRVYADASHIEAIKNILALNNISLRNISFVPITFRDSYSILGLTGYYLLLRRILSEIVLEGEDKLFFLSITPPILYLIKRLKRYEFKKMKFTFVLHGDFENIAEGFPVHHGLSLPITTIPSSYKNRSLIDLASKVSGYLWNRSERLTYYLPWRLITSRLFTLRKTMELNHSEDFRYIVCSPHIRENAKEYIDVENLNVSVIVLPTIFRKPLPSPRNAHIKFATFGYGNSVMMYNIALQLSQKDIKNFYEIRIIGMDCRGTKSFENITCPGKGMVLDRNDMENYAYDIDMFLILYDTNQHRLGCGGAIMESLSYMKPIIHFKNECIDTFNTPGLPIGIRCNDLEEYVNTMAELIENYELYQPKLLEYRKNMEILRKRYAIINSVNQLKKSFTWERNQ